MAGCCSNEPDRLDGPGSGPGEMDEKVTAVYKGVGLIMKRFTTGKVPKAFKIIPNLQNWEEVSLRLYYRNLNKQIFNYLLSTIYNEDLKVSTMLSYFSTVLQFPLQLLLNTFLYASYFTWVLLDESTYTPSSMLSSHITQAYGLSGLISSLSSCNWAEITPLAMFSRATRPIS